MARGKGEGTVYKDAEGRWRAAVPLPPDPVTGRRRRKVVRGRTRAEAVRRMRQVQLEVARTGDVPTGRTLSVAGWLERWLERDVEPVLKPSTAADYRTSVVRHIVPAIGRRRLDRLTPDDVRAVHRAVLGGGASTTTAAKVHRCLSRALTVAEREGLVPRNVARLVTPPPASTAAPDRLTLDQVRTLLASRKGYLDYPRRLTSFMIGARQGEVLGITLDGLHLDAGAPSVELAWEVRRVRWAHGCGPQAPSGAWPCGRTRGADCPTRYAPVPAHLEAEQVHDGLWLLRPKTKSSWRRVALPPPLTEALRKHITATRPERFAFEAAPGIPYDPRRDWQEWKDSLAAAALPHVRLHSARHVTATLLLEAGVPQRLIQEILGQTQALTTARYQHPSLPLQAAALAQATSALTLSTDPPTRPDPGPA